MGRLLYYTFLKLYEIAFGIAALFNNKARLGITGRRKTFAEIKPGTLSYKQQLIWMHCASLGEFEQGRPVLEILRKEYPEVSIVLSFFSASGYEAMKSYKGAGQVFYLPFDSPSNAKELLDILNPSLVLWGKIRILVFLFD